MSVNTSLNKVAAYSWTHEELLPNADIFFNSIIHGIQDAKEYIIFETYIFQDGEVGKRVESALVAAAKRGINVRVVVDGVGSPGWIFSIGTRLRAHGVNVKVYHQLPWEKVFSSDSRWEGSPSLITLFTHINRRDHRKVCVIDGSSAWVGSMNVWDVTSPAIMGDKAWRELGIKVQGEAVKILEAAFELVWLSPNMRNRRQRKASRRIVNQSLGSAVRLNARFRLRLKVYRDLLSKIENAKKRVWIANAYFVPAGSLISTLKNAAARGVDVRLVVSARSDIFFMPWVSAAFQKALLATKVKLFGYQASIFHAKYMIIDDWTVVGSSNINQRSLLHDLEADVTSNNQGIVEAVVKEYQKDLDRSEPITRETFAKRPLWQKLMGQITLLFRYFI